MKKKTLVVITGPTGVGKTEAAIEVATALGCEIINADSRQVYRGLPIGTAAPTPAQRARVRHHLVEFLSLEQAYSAWQFEQDVLKLLPGLWEQGDFAVMSGGSMMYVDAVVRGIDPMPTISEAVREAVMATYLHEGLAPLLSELERLDPVYYARVDKSNMRRVMHAVEVCRQAGVPFSSLRTGGGARRDFNVVKVALNVPRDVLFDRINRRVDAMMEAGLEQEARGVYRYRHLNALNTVGYKEIFAWLDGAMDRDTAVARMKKNTRVYAKKQLTWLKRDEQLTWLTPDEWPRILELLA